MAQEAPVRLLLGGLWLDGANLDMARADITATASGDTALVAAQGAGNRIYVLWVVVTWNTSVNLAVRLRSAANNISGAHTFDTIGEGWALSCTPMWFARTNANEALTVNLSAVGNVTVEVGYVVAP